MIRYSRPCCPLGTSGAHCTRKACQSGIVSAHVAALGLGQKSLGSWSSASARYVVQAFVNVATGGFGTELTVKTDENLKKSMGGAAYVLTGTAAAAAAAAARLLACFWQHALYMLVYCWSA